MGDLAEPISYRAVLGTLVALSGAAILLRGEPNRPFEVEPSAMHVCVRRPLQVRRIRKSNFKSPAAASKDVACIRGWFPDMQ